MPKNAANAVTLFRIALTPIFWWAWATGRQPLATVLFGFGCVTDGIDGWIARKWSQESLFGQLTDPIADKLLLSGAFVIGSMREIIPLWVTGMVVARDFCVLLGGVLFGLLWRGRHSLKKFAPTLIGKLSTIVEITVISLILLGEALRIPMLYWPTPSYSVVWLLLLATALITLASGTQYLVRALKVTFPS